MLSASLLFLPILFNPRVSPLAYHPLTACAPGTPHQWQYISRPWLGIDPGANKESKETKPKLRHPSPAHLPDGWVPLVYDRNEANAA
jgi:hypothetical protein